MPLVRLWSRLTALCLAPLLLNACATNVDRVVGRYKSAECAEPGQEDHLCSTVEPRLTMGVTTIATLGGSAVAPTAAPLAGPAAGSTPAASPTPAAATSTTASTPANAFSFSDRGQAAFINAYASVKDPPAAPGPAGPAAPGAAAAAFRKYLAAPIKADPPSALVDLTVFHRTMVVTVSRDALKFNPADRVEDVDIIIQPDNAVITSWDTAATAYATINAGSLQLTGTNSLTSGGSLGTPSTAPVAASLTGTYTSSSARQENLTATQQVETLTVSLEHPDSYQIDPANPNRLHIHRQGGFGVDLTGNIILKVDIAVPDLGGNLPVPDKAGPRRLPDPLDPSQRWIMSVTGDYFDGTTGKRSDPDTLKISLQTNRIAASRAGSAPPSITAKATLIYTLRHITAGDDTLEEKDDVVREVTSPAKDSSVVLVPGRDVVPRAYGVTLQSAIGDSLQIQRPNRAVVPVCFGSYGEAVDFINYLQSASAHPERFAKAVLGFNTPSGQRPLNSSDLSVLVAFGHCADAGAGAGAGGP